MRKKAKKSKNHLMKGNNGLHWNHPAARELIARSFYLDATAPGRMLQQVVVIRQMWIAFVFTIASPLSFTFYFSPSHL